MPDQALLVRSLVQLADNLVDDFDVIDLLTLLSDRCVDIFDVATAGVMLATPRGELQVVASSSDAMRVLELYELQADDGPCVDCYRSGAPVVNSDLLALSGRWPKFAPRAVAAGFRSAYALPMRLRGQTIGALNLFRTDTGPLEAADVQAAQALADVATIAIIQHKTAVDSQVLNSQLQVALTSRVIVEQAKGRISEATGVDMDQAFVVLRNHSRNHNIRLSDLCANLVDGTMRPGALDPLKSKRGHVHGILRVWTHIAADIWTFEGEDRVIAATVTRHGPLGGQTGAAYRTSGPLVEHVQHFYSLEDAQAWVEALLE